ncbi:TATA box-binding protein-like protein 1 [Sarcoptes scabiei]|nr:TATA box-binding protein-like protein 1 [Sarcoptes scabiei]
MSLYAVSSFKVTKYRIGYREWDYDPDRPKVKLLAEFGCGLLWWWIGWHFMTEWRHLIGENIIPQRSEWTDEELGIPSD